MKEAGEFEVAAYPTTSQARRADRELRDGRPLRCW